MDLGQGTYDDITVTQTGCTSIADIDVTLSDPATATIAIDSFNDPTTCLGTDGSLVLSGLAVSTSYDVSYVLNAGAPVVSSISSDGSGLLSIPSLGSGAYTSITVTLAGCTSNGVSQTLTDPATPTLALTSSSDPTSLFRYRWHDCT